MVMGTRAYMGVQRISVPQSVGSKLCHLARLHDPSRKGDSALRSLANVDMVISRLLNLIILKKNVDLFFFIFLAIHFYFMRALVQADSSLNNGSFYTQLF